MVVKLKAQDIHIWQISFDDLQNVSAMTEDYQALLSKEELEHAGVIRVQKHKTIYILAKMLVRKVLSDYCDIQANELQFAQNPYGKPYLVNEETAPFTPQFNLSHCGNCILLGVTKETALGVDVEMYNPSLVRDVDAIAAHFFTPYERDYIANSGAAQHAFLQLWTLKEAWVKCIGKGLSMPLNGIEFRLACQDRSSEAPENSDEKMQFYQWFNDNGNQSSLCLDVMQSHPVLTFYTMDKYWRSALDNIHPMNVPARFKF